jgi:hypothetical protein
VADIASSLTDERKDAGVVRTTLSSERVHRSGGVSTAPLVRLSNGVPPVW